MRKIERLIKKYQIKLVEILFLDIFGNERNIIIPSSRICDALKYGLKCDGSNVCCEQGLSDSDARIIIDESSYFVMPNNTLVLMSYTDSKYDARKNLCDIEHKINSKGFEINFGAEIEFFLFKTKEGKVDFDSTDKEIYYGNIENNFFECLSATTQTLLDNGIEVEAFHHEVAENQFELDFKYSSPTKTADRVVFVKKLLRYYAKQHNLIVCFMPKPKNFVSGNGMHINMSIFKQGENLFYSANDKNGLGKFAYNYINNLLKHITAITAFSNPIINSYKRLNSGYEAPTKIKYSKEDRSVLIRIPNATKKTSRIELRSPDVSCNPYLTFASILKASFCNLFGDKEKQSKLPENLPRSLRDSINALEKDNFISSLVPKEYINKKICECNNYDTLVNSFDIDNYFNV